MRIVIGSALLIITLAMAVLISLYFSLDSIYTQIFYIPIILVGLWNYRKSIYVALLFGFIHIFLGFYQITVAHYDVSMTDQFIRACMYLLVAFVVGTLSERQAGLLSKVKESEEQYRFIATYINDCIIALDFEGRLTYANPRTAEVTGYSQQDLLGKHASTLVPGIGHEDADRLFKAMIDAGKPLQSETEITTKSGTKITIEINTSLLRNSQGTVTGVVAAFRDVTERKRTQVALQHSLDLSVTLLESFPGLIWRTGPDGKGTYFNRNWLEFTGQSLEHQSGDGWIEGIHEQDREKRMRAMKEAFESRKPFESEFRMRRKDGSYRWLLESGRPFPDMDGSFGGYIGFAYDITERKAAAEEIQDRNRELGLINSISSSINRSRDMQGMLYSVLTDTTDLLQVKAGAIYLANNARPGQMMLYATLPYVTNGAPELFRKAFIPAVRVDTGKVYATDDGRSECIALPNGKGSVVTVPISSKSKLVGLMAFYAGTTDDTRHLWEAEHTAAQLLSIGSQIGIAIENQLLFSKVTETSQHLSDIIDESPDAMLTTDTAGIIRSFNKSASRLLKYAPEEVTGKHLSTLLPPGTGIKIDTARSYLREFRCKDDTLINLNISASRLSRSDINDGYIITLKDLSGISGLKIVPISEKAVDYDQEYHFNRGMIYLMDKSRMDHHMDIFTDQVRHNIQGLCITRQNPKAIRDLYGLEKTPVVWLNGGDVAYVETAIKPGNISSLTATIADFVAKTDNGVVMLDGMEYMMARNGFESMLKFVQYLNDKIMTSNSRALFCIDTGALDDKQKHLLLTEMTEFKEQA